MNDYRSIVVLTGAGISAESGIQTFRASDGLWENHRIEDVATPEAFARNPLQVHDFYNARRRSLQTPAIRPNPAHSALARLEYEWHQAGRSFLLVTQNIDNLHERAGSEKLIHMHGELLKARCAASELTYPWTRDLRIDDECRCCRHPGNLRPHVVWFGEIPLQMPQITRALEQCDLFIAIGTSGQVYPAAGFQQLASRHGADTLEINLEKTGSNFDQHIYGPASETVPSLVRELIQTIRHSSSV